jgi:hypothetical protein
MNTIPKLLDRCCTKGKGVGVGFDYFTDTYNPHIATFGCCMLQNIQNDIQTL